MPADPEDTAAALAAQVAELRGELGQVRANLAAWKDEAGKLIVSRVTFKQVTKDVERLRKDVDQLAVAAAAARKAGGKSGEDAGPPAICWPDLATDEQATVLAQLADWVTSFLRPNYPDYPFVSCWTNHPTAIWELGGLWQEWLRVYQGDEGPDLEASLWWHERWLPGVLNRLGKINCDEGGCQMLARRARGQPEVRPYGS